MKAVILFLGFCCLTLPAWSQATVISFEEETWLSPRRVGTFRNDRGAYRNPKMLLDFLQREYPDVKIRRWVRPGVSREEGYREDIEAYQNHIRKLPSNREGPIRLEAFRIRYGEIENVRTLVSTLVPDVKFQVDGKTLAVTGPANGVAQAREVFSEIDLPLDEVMLSYRLSEYNTELQRKTGVVWSDPALTESRMDYVLGVPLSKTPTASRSRIKLGSFAVSSWIPPREPSSVVPLVKGAIRMPRQRTHKRR